MSKNRYNYEIINIDALEAFAKNAVVVKKIPVRGMITKMLDAGVDVAGIKLITESHEVQEQAFENEGGFIAKVREKANK